MGRKKEIAEIWLAAMNPRTRIGQNEKILKLYTDFLFSWLGLIFLGKDKTTGTERQILKYLVALAPDQLISKIHTATKQDILELAKLRVRNENPPKEENTGFEETEKLDTELLTGDERRIIEATLGLLYVVRCNLFHADKSLDETRDNDIMKYASRITVNVSEHLIRELP